MISQKLGLKEQEAGEEEEEVEEDEVEALRATGHNRPPNRPPKFMTDDHRS